MSNTKQGRLSIHPCANEASRRSWRGVITARAIESASRKAIAGTKDVWLTDPGARGQGRFTIRCTPSGARVCMYRYMRSDGKRDIIKVADYDPHGVAGLSLHEARERAGAMVRIAASGGDPRAALEHVGPVKVDLADAAGIGQTHAESRSLAALYRAYALTLSGRSSHYDAQSMFRLHVAEPFPSLAACTAKDVRAEELRDVLARLIEAGKGRTAAKLRAYLRAAYALAMRAGLDPTLPATLTAFSIELNPADRLPSLAQFSKALDRALTLPELRAFWKRLVVLPVTPARDALVTCILLGGQRPTQLLRLTPRDVDISDQRLTLLDPKGRNRHGKPRRHALPISEELMPVIRRRFALTESIGAPLFSTGGRVALRKETVAALVRELAKAMAVTGELERGAFSLRDLRRTAETHMAALGVSSDVRAQIQSHGLGGIQARHYDRHDYMPEKRAALAMWVVRVKGEAAHPIAPVLDGARLEVA